MRFNLYKFSVFFHKCNIYTDLDQTQKICSASSTFTYEIFYSNLNKKVVIRFRSTSLVAAGFGRDFVI